MQGWWELENTRKQRVQVQVDAGRLGLIIANNDAPFGSLLTNGALTEYH